MQSFNIFKYSHTLVKEEITKLIGVEHLPFSFIEKL